MNLKFLTGSIRGVDKLGGISAAAILAAVTLSGVGLARPNRAPTATAQSENVPAGAPANPADLVREMVDNEIKAETTNDSFWQFKQTTQKGGKSEVDDIVETTQGNLQRVISRDGHPLDASESRMQVAHIKYLVSHPRAWERSQRDVKEDDDKANDFLKLLPVAFTFRYGEVKDGNVDLKATPNPTFRPRQRETEVFHHMAGDVWINLAEKRMARLDGKLISPVNFGAGILGHLDEGGTFVVVQKEVGPKHWEITELDVHMNGKALIFKTISVQQEQTDTDFKEVANPMTLDAAAKLLTEPPSVPEAGQEQRAGSSTVAKKKRGA